MLLASAQFQSFSLAVVQLRKLSKQVNLEYLRSVNYIWPELELELELILTKILELEIELNPKNVGIGIGINSIFSEWLEVWLTVLRSVGMGTSRLLPRSNSTSLNNLAAYVV